MKLYFILTILLSACATQKHKVIKPASPQAPTVINRDLWLNRHSDELLLHPIFASLPLEKRRTTSGIEVMSFKNAGGSVDNQVCNINQYSSFDKYGSSGSGSGICTNNRIEISCNHVFYVKNNLVNDYRKVGGCFKDERIDFRPFDKEGKPIITKKELLYIKELREYEEKYADKEEVLTPCEKSAECTDGMSCRDNMCQHLGLWGRLFNP